MANLPETPNQFDAGVYQLETNDPVIGGAAGVSNSQSKALANRTLFLKDAIDEVITAGGGAPDNVDPALLLAALQNGFGLAKSFSTTGYAFLPGGLVLQWGYGDFALGSIVFPIAFPSACLSVAGINNEATGLFQGVTAVSPTSFTPATSSVSNDFAWWLAIGH